MDYLSSLAFSHVRVEKHNMLLGKRAMHYASIHNFFLFPLIMVIISSIFHCKFELLIITELFESIKHFILIGIFVGFINAFKSNVCVVYPLYRYETLHHVKIPKNRNIWVCFWFRRVRSTQVCIFAAVVFWDFILC